jgi:hypothetical protein
VHGVVPIEPAKRVECAIYVVDTIILNLDQVAILDPIFDHSLIFPRSVDIGEVRRAWPRLSAGTSSVPLKASTSTGSLVPSM